MHKLIEIMETQRVKNEFYLNLIKKIMQNLLKLYNKTEINKRNEIFSVLTDLIPKQVIRKEGFIFSDTMYRTAKRKS